VAKTQILFKNGLGLLAVRPHLVVLTAAMGAHDPQERTVFEPAGEEFGIVVVSANIVARVRWIKQRRVRRMMFGGEILPTADIVRPVRHSAGCEVEASGNLAFVRVPRGKDIG